MPAFISAHVITCMTRQDLDRLLRRLLNEGAEGEVKILNVRCDTVSGRMVCEWDAPSQDTLVAWLDARHIRFRSNEEWCMPVRLASKDGRMIVS